MTMPRIHESAENYLETIYRLQKQLPQVRSIDIANELDYSKPSVSIAMKNLRKNGCIQMDNGGIITLTETGRKIAENIYERHDIFMRLLIELGVSEKNAAEDACRIEHVVSNESFEAIKKHLLCHLCKSK